MEKRWIWPFELEEQIGAGAMGVVYRARFVKNDRRVALKLLPSDVAANATLAARFQREMELLKTLRHPHIVHCFGGTCEGNHQFYAMELVEGGTLASLLTEQGRLPWRQAVDFGLQICAALEYAHARQIIHRDLKPGNLLITRAGKLKLGDFGLAQVAAETKLTAAGKTVGSLHYMAPEQIQGKPPLSHRTDLYAFGCVLYEMLTGHPPFQGDAMAEILQRHVRESPPPITGQALDCPPQLERLAMELLAKSPENRPADAPSVSRRLHEIDQGVTIKLPRFDRNRPIPPASATETISTDTFRAATGGLCALVATLVVLGACAGWLVRSLTVDQHAAADTLAALMTGLSDPQPAVRQYAARALGEIGPDRTGSVPALIRHLTDADPRVRTEVAHALGKSSVDNDVLLALKKSNREDSDPLVRDAAAQAEAALRARPAPSRLNWSVLGLAGLASLIASGLVWVWRREAV